jgi:iron complex outermembrane recepter protein
MKNNRPVKSSLLSVVGWLALALGPGSITPAAAATSATPATGSITGRVQNVVTGQYLNKARLTIKGTNQVVFTDDFGTYNFAEVPGGPVVLEVFYTGLDTREIALEVRPGGSIEHNVDLSSAARYGENAAVVKLDPFVVASGRETDAQAIANNEQRFAPNIKNVMSTESLGDVLGSSVGEFLKFIPGVAAEYDNASIIGVTIRGIGGSMTSFSADGSPMVSSGISMTRSFDTNSMALNDISRLEVTKVPTPSTPADSLAGSVNMVSKSAFERSSAQFRYGLTLVGNGENLTLKKTPSAYYDRGKRKLNPGFNFDYTLPLGKHFGLVATGLRVNRFNEQHISQMTYAVGGTATGASLERPFLQSHLLADDPRNEARTTFSLKADWRATRHSVLSVSGQWNNLVHSIGNNRLTSSVGANGTPTPAGGVALSFGPDFTTGATGRGSVTLSSTNQRYEQTSVIGKASYRFNNGTWKVESAASRSDSKVQRRNTEHGHFHTLSATLVMPVRVSFSAINPDHPGAMQVFDAASQPVDFRDINNYRVTTATDIPLNKRATFESAIVSVRRRLGMFPVPVAVQLGSSVGIQTVDIRTGTRTWTYNGPDGNAATPDTPVPYLMRSFVNQNAGYGYGQNLPWFSARHAWAAFQANPILFSQTPAQLVAQEVGYITNSEFLEEKVSAYYVQGETSLFKDRLKVLTGVRYEKTEDDGEGQLFDPNAVWVRNADGTFARNAAGTRIRRPEAGAVGSMEELRLTRQERAYRGHRTYDGFFPSLHLTYEIRENFLARGAYAKTYGRPNFTDIIPSATINEADLTDAQLDDPEIIKGNITVRNTALRPWMADNIDLSFEYYTQHGGLFAAGVFLKEIKDFFGTTVKIATTADVEALGLDPRYVGWNLNTKFNSGDARVTGAEINIRHPLRDLGRWGEYFTVFANFTKLKLEGNQQASFTSFIPESGNWGTSFSRRKLTLVARWNYRGLDKRAALPAFGPDAFTFIEARTTLDLSVAYQLARQLSLTASVNNVFDVPQVQLRYGSQTPAYARQFNTRNFGAMLSVGVRGSF